MSLRTKIVDNCHWAMAHRNTIYYTQSAKRSVDEHRPFAIPMWADCSMFAACMFSWAGAPDPLGMHFDGTGYTGTEITADKQIGLSQVQPGDLIVYGPGTGEHTAIIVDVSGVHRFNPLTVSHGGPGGPSYVEVKQDGRMPQRYFRVLPPDPIPSPIKVIATAPFVALATLIKSPVTVAANYVRAKRAVPTICPHPHGGEALCYGWVKVFQGIPDQPNLQRLLGVGVKRGTMTPTWWASAHQEPW